MFRMFRPLPCVAALCLLSVVALSHAAAKPRNILWISSDDHAAFVTACYGNEIVRTPNIDRLAKSAVRFARAYCNAPVCSASRASFITGRYPRSVGVTLLRTPLPAKALTLAEMLKARGYHTGAIGKMHFNSNLTHGFDLRLDRREHRQMLQKRGAKPLPQGVQVLPQWKPFRDPARIWLNADALPFGAVDADMANTWFAQAAADYLAKRGQEQAGDGAADSDNVKPFFLMVSFNQPHSPFRFPIEYAGKYKPSQFDVPRVGPDDRAGIAAIFRDLTGDDIRGIQAAYYTAVEYMDKNVGLVLDALTEAGLDDNTLVIYCGDHGYMLGHHGRIEKHCTYEPAIHSPLILRWPGQSPRVSQALVEFIDIVPTALAWAQAPTPNIVQGKSLAPIIQGQTDHHRDHVFVEYAQNDEVMVRDHRWKLIYLRGEKRRVDGYDSGLPLPGPHLKFFDTKNDPGEFTNLANQPDHQARIKTYLTLLVNFLKTTSRHPHLIPDSNDPMVILRHCVQSRDPSREEALK